MTDDELRQMLDTMRQSASRPDSGADDERKRWRRITEIAAHGRPDTALSAEELTQKIREIAERDRVGPSLTPEEVMRRDRTFRAIGCEVR